MPEVALKRAYEEASTADGQRILVERLWPRGVSKEKAALDLWVKDIAPTTGLRQWYGHEPAKWPEFQRRYRRELTENPAAVAELRQKIKQGKVTLVYGAKDEKRNSAVVLKDYLENTPGQKTLKGKSP